MARQWKYKFHDGSDVNTTVAAKTSVNCQGVTPESLRQAVLTLTHVIMEETHVLHIRDRNNQRHILLQRKRVPLDGRRAVCIIRGFLAL